MQEDSRTDVIKEAAALQGILKGWLGSCRQKWSTKKPGDLGSWHGEDWRPLPLKLSLIKVPKYWGQCPGPFSAFMEAELRACRTYMPDPTSHFPQIASELKDTISTRLRSARNSISVPIASTSDKVLGAALSSCERAWGVARDTAEYATHTRAGRLASGGANLALSGVEKVVEFLLPPAKEDSGICH